MDLIIQQEAAHPRPMRHGEVLQGAFAALVADGAVERVRSEQEFQNLVAPGDDLFCAGAHHHAVRNRGGARRIQLRAVLDLRRAVFVELGLPGRTVDHRAANFHQAHTAHAHRLHLGMVAEHRDIITDHLRGVDYQRPGGHLYRLIINH